MSEDEIHQPHDKLFASTFGLPANAAAFLKAKLSPAVSGAVDWGTLQLLPGSFVDSQYRRSHTDLLFSVTITEQEALVYVLFEHQTTPDRLIALRLLRYLVRIWEDAARGLRGGERLPFILPVVLSQNGEWWDVPTHFADLIDLPQGIEAEAMAHVPGFAFHHEQLAGMPYEDIPGTPSGILVLRAMKAESLGDLLGDPLWDESLILSVLREVFQAVLRYMLGADIDKEAFETKENLIRDPVARTDAMTLAQRYRQEGRQEGQSQGRGEGRIIGRQEDVIEALAIRFGALPAGLREEILAVTDEARLRDLLRNAILCETVEAFAASI